MNNILITVRVADREYRLNIEREKEELVREAVKRINETIKRYAENYDFKDKQDLLAMVVLQNTIKAMELDLQVSFQQNQLASKLIEIDRLLTESLSGK
ncbi:MAG TPA: cell division protein ZapA [Bacteroidales bacterium]|jgi:cell division protein ZapA (FtsZ GTPase activity inhibitor)|nr:cell division protein ZapA [Bacteroidales bacterium]NLH33052.1 cell division protein ZapA [Lentimicrobium sp.]OQC36433.1 MAG: Cell division protein ZapA [Bacteroidetes bacterium ADurb.Bin041]MBP7873268.1 cell division protein ZapA [Bacteroidales bacterium]MCZ2283246.1 cell division protein ZapA [Bacteroidales bacterium]